MGKIYGYGIPAQPTSPLEMPRNAYDPEPVNAINSKPIYSHKKVTKILLALDDAELLASGGKIFNFKGTCVYVPYSTNASDRVQIGFNSDSDFFSMGPSACPAIGGIPFDSFRIFVPSAVGGAVMELCIVTDGVNGPLDEIRFA